MAEEIDRSGETPIGDDEVMAGLMYALKVAGYVKSVRKGFVPPHESDELRQALAAQILAHLKKSNFRFYHGPQAAGYGHNFPGFKPDPDGRR